MKTKWFWMMCMIIMASLVTVSCGDDDDEGGTGNAPKGTITVNLTKNPNHIVDFGGNYGSVNWISSSNNFFASSEILSLGEKNGLGSINTDKIPESGWTKETACKPGYAYIVRCGGSGVYYYTGIYLVRNIISTSGGIMGVEIQYCNFTPDKGWNQ